MRSCIEGSADAIHTRYCNFVKVVLLSIMLMTLFSKDHFNYLVTHNAMKWQPCERREGIFSYDDADGAVAWAKANKIPMRGHALLWATGDQIICKDYLELHITNFVSRHTDAQLARQLQRH